VQYTYDNANKLICTAVRMNPSAFASPPVSACLQGTAGANGPTASPLLRMTPPTS